MQDRAAHRAGSPHGAGGRLSVARARPADWRRYRALRLTALADSPDAFESTLHAEAQKSDADWQHGLESETWITFLGAIDAQDLGLAVRGPYDEAAGLYAMWVAPDARGRGLGDRLVEAVIRDARERGYRELRLDVADGNRPALRLYRRHGFEASGIISHLPPPRQHMREHQFRLVLKAS